MIYILAYPIYSFILPLYSFWCFDESVLFLMSHRVIADSWRSFTWGSTRIVVGEGKSKKIISNDEEVFDESIIPMKKFSGTYHMLKHAVQPLMLCDRLSSCDAGRGRQHLSPLARITSHAIDSWILARYSSSRRIVPRRSGLLPRHESIANGLAILDDELPARAFVRTDGIRHRYAHRPSQRSRRVRIRLHGKPKPISKFVRSFTIISTAVARESDEYPEFDDVVRRRTAFPDGSAEEGFEYVLWAGFPAAVHGRAENVELWVR